VSLPVINKLKVFFMKNKILLVTISIALVFGTAAYGDPSDNIGSGMIWTDIITDSTFGTYDILAIVFGNGKFVAGGGFDSGKTAYSAN
jgi:hypothetical protein